MSTALLHFPVAVTGGQAWHCLLKVTLPCALLLCWIHALAEAVHYRGMRSQILTHLISQNLSYPISATCFTQPDCPFGAILNYL